MLVLSREILLLVSAIDERHEGRLRSRFGRPAHAEFCSSPLHRFAMPRNHGANGVRQNSNLSFHLNSIPPVQSFSKKFSVSRLTQITSIFPPSRPHLEGRIAIVTDVGYGMRWTQTTRLTSALPRGRRSRVVLTPRRWRQVLEKQTSQGRRWQESPVTEEITKETVKTIAQGRPDCSGEPVVTMLVWFPSFPREAAGATGTRLSLRPRFRGERTDARLGRDGPREGGCAGVILLFEMLIDHLRRPGQANARAGTHNHECAC
jgi:hypothetical protein